MYPSAAGARQVIAISTLFMPLVVVSSVFRSIHKHFPNRFWFPFRFLAPGWGCSQNGMLRTDEAVARIDWNPVYSPPQM
jgi:hypothetical protein